MENKVHDFYIDLDWNLVALISEIDRFDSNWTAIQRREGQSLKHLKSVATVRSVGASTRIEGSKMSDEEVDVFLKSIDITKLKDRDSQEVAGYFDTLNIISASFKEIDITESSIKSLHNSLMKYSQKDEWHKGNYKQHSNVVEAIDLDGTRQVVFQPAEAGLATENAMRTLCEWHRNDAETHILVKCAAFTYEFLSIHPFQDGNGRMSRLLSTLLLLKGGYEWIRYVSFEHEIETRKIDYYQALRSCQAKRPNENITEWIWFFFTSLRNIQGRLMGELDRSGLDAYLAPREKSIIAIISNYPGIRSGEIGNRLAIPLPTVKRILADLVTKGIIERQGKGRGTHYAVK